MLRMSLEYGTGGLRLRLREEDAEAQIVVTNCNSAVAHLSDDVCDGLGVENAGDGHANIVGDDHGGRASAVSLLIAVAVDVHNRDERRHEFADVPQWDGGGTVSHQNVGDTHVLSVLDGLHALASIHAILAFLRHDPCFYFLASGVGRTLSMTRSQPVSRGLSHDDVVCSSGSDLRHLNVQVCSNILYK